MTGGAGFDILGVRELQAALDRMVTQAQATAVEIVNKSEAVLEADIKSRFTGQHKKGTPTTSSPGSPPDVVSGTLRRSIAVDRARMDGLSAVGRVYPTAVYSRIQEMGGSTGRGGHTVLPARPYVRPSLDASGAKLSAIATEGWRKLT